MPSLRIRTGPRGTTYAVLFRESGRQTSETFADEASAHQFMDLIDRMGVAGARRVLDARDQTKTTTRLPTVAEQVTRHIDQLSGVSVGTIRGYRTIARQIADTPLGMLPIDVVRREDVTAWIREQEESGGSAKTIRNRQSLLSAALARAVDDELVPRNPAHRIRVARTERREMTFLTPREFAILLERATPHYRPLLMTLFGTGLRLGEATALRPSDIHLDDVPPTLTIARAWKAGGGLGAPKTAKGRRTIALPTEVAEVLAPLVEQHRHERRPPQALLFTNLAGRRILQATLHDLWQTWIDDTVYDSKTGTRVPREPALRKRPRIHDLRHSHASFMISRGMNLFDLAHRLGHESITTTTGTYGHLQPEYQVQAARAASWTEILPPHDPQPLRKTHPRPGPRQLEASPHVEGPEPLHDWATELGLTTRAANVVRRSGARNLDDLAAMTADDLRALPYCSDRVLNEIVQCLRQYGIEL